MPNEVPIDHRSIQQNPKVQQNKPPIAGPRRMGTVNASVKVESKAEPGARYQFLTSMGEFRGPGASGQGDIASYEQIHGHMGIGCPDDHDRHTGADVVDLIKRGIIEQVPKETPLTDNQRQPAIDPDAMDKYRQRMADKVTERAAREIIIQNSENLSKSLKEQGAAKK